MDAPPPLWRQAERLARQGAAEEEVTFTSEYERMRPLDEDRHDRAVVFTVAKEPSFDIQQWFINYLRHKAKLILPEPRRVSYEELVDEDEDEVEEYAVWYKDGVPLPPEEQHWWCVPYTNCACGARATYLVRNQWVCINHVNR